MYIYKQYKYIILNSLGQYFNSYQIYIYIFFLIFSREDENRQQLNREFNYSILELFCLVNQFNAT